MSKSSTAAVDGHTDKRKPRKTELLSYPLGDLEIEIVCGSVFAPADQDQPLAVAQTLRITVLFLVDGVRVYRKKKVVTGAPNKALFTNVPADTCIVVVQNLSDAPSYPGATAEVRVAPTTTAQLPGKAATKSPPTRLKIRLSTDSLVGVARRCGFRIGARENVPEREGIRLNDQYPDYFNARIVTAFWSASNLQQVPSPPVQAGQSFVVLPTGPNQTTGTRRNWDGIPTDPGFGAPSLTAWLPGNPPSVVPMNLYFVRDDGGMPLQAGGREIYGLLQAEKDGTGPGIPYDAQNRLQITFVRRTPDGNESALEIVPGGDIPAVGIRYIRYHPTLDSAQYTALVWYNANGKPPPHVAAGKPEGDTLIAEIAKYVGDAVHIRKTLPDAQQQYVVVNEPLISNLGKTALTKGKLGQRIATKLLTAAQEKTAKRFHATLRGTAVPPALVNQWLVQHDGRKHWISPAGKTVKYILRAFSAAAAADPKAMLILNEHTCESIEAPKGLALAVLARTLKKRLGSKGGNAGGRLAVGFQMHLGDKYYKPGKKQPFLSGLAKSMDYYTQAGTRVFVTEMAIRPPGLAAADRQYDRLQQACTLARIIAVVTAPDYFPAPPPPPAAIPGQPPPPVPDPVVVQTTDPTLGLVVKKTHPDGSYRIELKLAVETPPEKKHGEKVAETLALVVQNGTLFVDHESAGADAGALQAWIVARKSGKGKKSENQRRARAIVAVLDKDGKGRFTNPGDWPEWKKRFEAIASGHVTTPSQRREQGDFFYKVVRTCLSRALCDDLSFWGLVESFYTDTYDWCGYMFSANPKVGSLAPGLPYYRMSAYFGVLQGLIEAAIARSRPDVQPYATALGRSFRTRKDHGYEEHLFPGL